MRRPLVPLFFALGTLVANAEGNTSAYTRFDFTKCRLIEPGDEYVYAGTRACDGYGGIDIIQSSADGRSFAAFGKNGMDHCTFRKTFGPYNTALSPIEWRLKDGKTLIRPSAPILRTGEGENICAFARPQGGRRCPQGG